MDPLVTDRLLRTVLISQTLDDIERLGDATLQEILGAILTPIFYVADGIGEGLFAITLGFATVPTAIGLGIVTIGILLLGVITPMGFRVESLLVAADAVETRNELIHVVILAGILGIPLGLGITGLVVDFIGEAVLFGIIAGVGILLARAAVTMTSDTEYRGNLLVGIVTIVVATVVFLFTSFGLELDLALVYTLIVSVVAGVIVANFVETDPIVFDMEHEQIKLAANWRAGYESLRAGKYRDALRHPLTGFYSGPVIWGALALVVLRFGGAIAFSEVNVFLADTVDVPAEANPDGVTLLSSLGGIFSGLFGGAPVEPLISAMAATQTPVLGAALFVALMTLVSFFKLIVVLAKRIPPQAIAGFIFALGALVIFPENMELAIQAGLFIGGVTAAVTAVTDPFTGLIAGVGTTYALEFFEATLPGVGLLVMALIVVDARSGKAQLIRGYLLNFLRRRITINNSPLEIRNNLRSKHH